MWRITDRYVSWSRKAWAGYVRGGFQRPDRQSWNQIQNTDNMKKSVIYLALMALLPLGACTSKGDSQKEENTVSDERFTESQPMASGEYRAISFQYGDLGTDRQRFDGRVIVALSPDHSGIYIYENGNRTDFKATIVLSKPFEKRDSVYLAYDSKDKPVTLIRGTENDTIVFLRRDTVTT